MAHLAPLPIRGSGLFVRLAYFIARRRLGRVPAPVGIMAHNRWVLAAAAGFELSIERARTIDLRWKELASLKVALLVGCRFCIDIGAALARTHGVTEGELRELPLHEQSTVFSALDKLVLDYAVQMTSSPMSVSKQLYDTLERELGAAGLVELTATIAWENFRARFNHAFGAQEEGFSKQTLCLLPALPADRSEAAHG